MGEVKHMWKSDSKGCALSQVWWHGSIISETGALVKGGEFKPNLGYIGNLSKTKPNNQKACSMILCMCCVLKNCRDRKQGLSGLWLGVLFGFCGNQTQSFIHAGICPTVELDEYVPQGSRKDLGTVEAGCDEGSICYTTVYSRQTQRKSFT